MKTLIIENINSTKNNSSNNGNRFEIILPGNTDKGKNYIINEDCYLFNTAWCLTISHWPVLYNKYNKYMWKTIKLGW